MGRNFLLPCFSALAILSVTAYATLHGAGMPIFLTAGPVAAAERDVIALTAGLAAIVVVPVFWFLFYFAWKYRANDVKTEEPHEPDWDHDNPIAEFVWWLVPACILVFLAVLSWQSSHALDPYRPLPVHGSNKALVVQAVALDWKWLFIYPAQGIASVNALRIPAGVPVTFQITADAPMNSLWIPALGGQIMAMPGMQTQLNLEADRAGIYNGFSGNISGEGFAGMAFKTYAVSPQAFDAWVSETQASSTALSGAEYTVLRTPSENDAPKTYARVDANLFGGIIGSYMPSMTSASTSAAQDNGMAGMQM